MGQCHGHGHDAAAQQSDPNDMAECPVMPGSMVVKSEAEEDGLVRDYNGQRYYLCCDSCGPLWDAEPAKYATA